MSGLGELIARIEQAGEGSRELDEEIWWKTRGAHGVTTYPHYSTSIDAAMTLVPEGWFIYCMGEGVKPITYSGDNHDHIDFWADIQRRERGGMLTKARAATPALALCIAALRARANLSQVEGEK